VYLLALGWAIAAVAVARMTVAMKNFMVNWCCCELLRGSKMVLRVRCEKRLLTCSSMLANVESFIPAFDITTGPQMYHIPLSDRLRATTVRLVEDQHCMLSIDCLSAGVD
jgi:hypothetical protein